MSRSFPSQSEDLLIRHAVLGDLPQLIELERLAPSAAHWSEDQFRGIFVTNHPRRLLLLAETPSAIAGFGVARIIDHESELENLVVRQEMRRRGVGSRLVQALIQAVQREGGTVFCLEVRESNSAARALYSKLGLREGSRRNRYYQNPEEDAILYRSDFQQGSCSENITCFGS